eukprot:1172529-Prorocentrum_minimum.AAC.1
MSMTTTGCQSGSWVAPAWRKESMLTTRSKLASGSPVAVKDRSPLIITLSARPAAAVSSALLLQHPPHTSINQPRVVCRDNLLRIDAYHCTALSGEVVGVTNETVSSRYGMHVMRASTAHFPLWTTPRRTPARVDTH